MFPDNSLTRKTTLQTNIIVAYIYENYDFLGEKPLKISFRTGQLFLCDNFFEIKVLKKHFGNMIYTRRGPVYHKFVGVCQCDLCKKYVQKYFLSDL